MHLESFVNTAKVGKLTCSLSLTSDHNNLALQAEHVTKTLLCCWFDHDGGRDRLSWFVVPGLFEKEGYSNASRLLKVGKSSIGGATFKLCLWRGSGRSGR
jgi:hypothetical protein